ncbi:hypothetical protein OF83DRAFT_1134247 [Amylostereum chailletii]|nr:hypothetical protein OF83DRAFT_1134247 [Amylostereum chailletii]
MFSRRLASNALKRSLPRASRGYGVILPMFQPHPPSLANKRFYATPPPQVKASSLDIEDYHNVADETMETLLDSLEQLLEECDNPSYEVEYHSGVLTLKLDQQIYVINKQPPNKQIWLSSPLSGPKRYDLSLEKNNWIYSRDGVSLNSLLEAELSSLLSREVELGLSEIVEEWVKARFSHIPS